MPASAISGDYVDIKFVKSRKVACITIEIPIEASDDFLTKFGAPRPAEGVPVALARLLPGKADEPAPKAPRKFDALALPQQAALLCDREAFWRYLNDRHSREVASADAAAEAVREMCGVTSRAQIKIGTDAAAEFFVIRDGFDMWMRIVA